MLPYYRAEGRRSLEQIRKGIKKGFEVPNHYRSVACKRKGSVGIGAGTIGAVRSV